MLFLYDFCFVLNRSFTLVSDNKKIYFLQKHLNKINICLGWRSIQKRNKKVLKKRRQKMNNNKSIEQKKSINYAAILLVFYDVIAVNLSYFLGLWFRFDCKFSLVESSGYLEPFAKFAPIYSVFCIVIFFLLRLYRSLWRYASFNEFSRILLASFITSNQYNCN